MNETFRIGVVTSPHGVRGEVKVYPTTEDMHRFSLLKEAVLTNGKTSETVHFESVKYFKNMVILKLKECNSMDEANLLRNRELYISREQALPLEEGEYYIADLIGLSVFSTEGEELGVLEDVLQTAANDVYQVRMKNGKELLLPVIDDCVKDIDLESKKITVYLMKGLLD